MFEEYLIALLTSRGFKYAATIAWMFGSTAWRIIKQAAFCIVMVCAVLIFIHWYFKIPYNSIFGEIKLMFDMGLQSIRTIWYLIIEFLDDLRANCA